MSTLPSRPSLESLRKQAKALLRGFRESAPEALAAVQAHHPKPERFRSLRDAQFAVAREYGYAGWPELTLAVEAALDAAGSLDEQAEVFADLICLCYSKGEDIGRRERAVRLLEANPQIAGRSVFAAAAAYDVEGLRRHLDQANRRGGPRNWTPLLYLAYSRAPEAAPKRDAVAAARMLLDAGADARFYVDGSEGLGGWRWSALTGVIGGGEAGPVQQPPHPRADELARLLLDAGADPNDSQALYNCHFEPDDRWLRLLLSRGLDAKAPADPARPTGEKTLDFQLGAAVRLGFVERVRLLLAHGANAAGRDNSYTYRTHVRNAVMAGQGEIVELLVEHGASRPELSPADRFRMAVVAGDEEQARALLAEAPAGQSDLLVSLAQQNNLAAVRLLLDLGVDPNVMAHNGRYALHEAAWAGRRALLELLLERGARLDLRSRAHGGTAVGYAHHAGRLDLRDWLLDRSPDLADLVSYGCFERLEAVLADPQALADAEANAEKLLEMARRLEDPATLDVLAAHGIGNRGL
ncbi:MAG: ankyrin repeat domain-containing protein [Acidobacteria bacterium]|nr:ankyrin repeat domain-containing protein [Acidobacteriota bacterium]